MDRRHPLRLKPNELDARRNRFGCNFALADAQHPPTRSASSSSRCVITRMCECASMELSVKLWGYYRATYERPRPRRRRRRRRRRNKPHKILLVSITSRIADIADVVLSSRDTTAAMTAKFTHILATFDFASDRTVRKVFEWTDA